MTKKSDRPVFVTYDSDPVQLQMHMKQLGVKVAEVRPMRAVDTLPVDLPGQGEEEEG